MSIEELLREIDSRTSSIQAPHFGPLVNWGQSMSMPIQRWFRYREAYSPLLVQELQLGTKILDPFCGCGSTLIGAARTNRTASGIDINPLAIHVARVKTTPLSQRQLQAAADYLVCFRQNIDVVECWPTPELSITEKVFEPDILVCILQLRQSLEDYSRTDSVLRSFLLLAWLAVLEQVGSYFKEGNGIKYRRRKRTPNGYVEQLDGKWQEQRFGLNQRQFVLETFASQLSLMLDDTSMWDRGIWRAQESDIGDALDLAAKYAGQSFDDIVFSPPYANRFDYFESQKVELWFGNFVNSYDDLIELRKRSVRSHLAADLKKPVLTNRVLEALIDNMDRNSSSWRMRVPLALRGYFADMTEVLQNCFSVLRSGGRCHIVVGNSAFGGVIFPADSLLAVLAEEIGYADISINIVRHLTVAPQQRSALNGLQSYMRESIVQMTRP